MQESIFRKKSLDKINSPEKMDDYIKVTGISMWVILGAVICLLLATICWACFAQIPVNNVTASGEVVSEVIKPIKLLVG